MKTALRHYLLLPALGLVTTLCSLPAQTPAPAAPSTGTPGTTSPRTGTNAGTQTNTGTRTTTGQTTTPTNQQTQPGQTTIAPGTTTATQPGQTTIAPGTTTATQPGQTTTGQTTTPSGATTTSRTGAAPPAGSTTLQAGTITSSGTISNLGADAFALQTTTSGTPTNFIIGEGTTFVDLAGNVIPRERLLRSAVNGRIPATVHYTQANNGNLMATKVVVSEGVVDEPVISAGTITEVSPGVLVIEQPGASATPVRYVNNKTTNYVNEDGEAIPPENVKAGTPVRVFYTKVGDTLVASRVEVSRGDKSGLPIPPVTTEKSTTTTKSTNTKSEEK